MNSNVPKRTKKIIEMCNKTKQIKKKNRQKNDPGQVLWNEIYHKEHFAGT